MASSRASPRTNAIAGIALSWLAWLVVVFAGFGGERSACPDPPHAAVTALAVISAIVATVAFVLAVSAYRSSAGAPSSTWLLGAAGLYITVLGWAATVTGVVALLLVDMCDLV